MTARHCFADGNPKLAAILLVPRDGRDEAFPALCSWPLATDDYGGLSAEKLDVALCALLTDPRLPAIGIDRAYKPSQDSEVFFLGFGDKPTVEVGCGKLLVPVQATGFLVQGACDAFPDKPSALEGGDSGGPAVVDTQLIGINSGRQRAPHEPPACSRVPEGASCFFATFSEAFDRFLEHWVSYVKHKIRLGELDGEGVRVCGIDDNCGLKIRSIPSNEQK